MLNKRIAIDLGTANSVVYVLGKGIVLNEPTVVAITEDDERVVAVGNDAKEMLGKTPEGITALRPLRDGVIADYAVTEAMLKYFINKSVGGSRIFKPDVMVSVPAGVTSVEARAVLDAAYSAGARYAYLIPEPLAAAIGTGLPISEPSGNMIVNIGGGTSEIAVVSLYGIVVFGSVRVAGNKIDEAIGQHIRRKYGLIIGDKTSEDVKKTIGTAFPLDKEEFLEVKGRDSISGLPKTILVGSHEVSQAIQSPLSQIVLSIKNVLEQTPPELSSDIIDKGFVLSGGTAHLRSLDSFISQATGVPTHVADEPLLCVVRGVAQAMESMDLYGKSVMKR
ncbi:rod shape-determining protein [candidate division WWE3 bacterium RIFCSPHIGHO2_01_FULL_40_23]|uniref:Cell shape-determining protein MreB n=1 Tax=candidate division WWE3 bacterium RIFCSPLOWO2_01_FULL_41_18 TaxID=1802625 RepID=A0A1F4VEA2_UNCKA|nr:MAG: rod shape-determining protein [candidate division WWE3 bacterium RIFCSPHIGHO2_01_FULL_40_23]OGC55576.1 MAG: rod shape-determining protein [candidate division WWE3 bacterium RIFCSPLOWO2_01_FULL_41_18]